jgi:hypothetical protein
MLSSGETNIFAGMLLQLLRGFLFGIVLWSFRKTLLDKKYGWFTIWVMIFIIGIINTPAASPASIEGVIYSRFPLWYHIMGLPEVSVQTFAFSVLIFFWDKSRVLKQQDQEKIKKLLPASVRVISLSLVISAFAYMGYAASAITGLLISGVQIDPQTFSASSTLESQIVFIVAFLLNAVSTFFIGIKKDKFKIPIPFLFAGFILLDIAIPYLYSLLFYPQPLGIPFTLFMGTIPGFIMAIATSIVFYSKEKKTVI